MNKPEILAELERRAAAGAPWLSAEDVDFWPAGAVEELTAAGMLVAAENATCLACHECGQDHLEEVIYVQSPPGGPLRAYIFCPDIGRIAIPLDRLRQWMINTDALRPATSEAWTHQGTLGTPADIPDEPLSAGAQTMLIAMVELKAFDSDSRQTTAEIVARAFGSNADANGLKYVMKELNVLQLIGTKGSRGGGCWLTTKGRARGEKLANRHPAESTPLIRH